MGQQRLWNISHDCKQRGAVIHGPYRYSLWRIWDEQLPRALFVLLNPSTADAQQDDPTLRRCLGFACLEGCGSLEIVNLFAYRATQPTQLKMISDPIGDENDQYIAAAAQQATLIILGWGVYGSYLARDRAILHLLSSSQLYCLGLTAKGHPKHPLYCTYASLIRFHPCA